VRTAAEVGRATGKEVERLRGTGLKGVHRVRVKGKDYDTDVDTFQTANDRGEWVKQFSYPFAFDCAYPPCLRGLGVLRVRSA
jgi:hypothetical protein